MRRALVVVCGVVALATFVFIYADLWVLVGRFPAESLIVGQRDSNAALALCYRPQPNKAEFSTFRSPYASQRMHAPVLSLGSGPYAGDVGAIRGSRNLAYAVDRKAVYSIGPLAADDLAHLDAFAFWGPSNRRDVDRFVTETRSLYPYCPDPQSDRGLTEAYWATKGTVVLHHWAFLYDASVFDGKPVHAQYGTLVSAVAHALATAARAPGPTGFVRFAWWVFCIVGIAAAAGLIFVLRRTPGIGVLAFSAQTLAFATLGSFSILLAPGYHWTRELAIVAPLLLVAVLERMCRASPVRRGLAIVAALVLGELVDPSFTLFASVCLLAALAIREHALLRRWIERRPRGAASALGAGAFAFAALLFLDRSNLGYVVSEVVAYSTAAVSDPGRNDVFLFNGILAGIALLLGWYRRVPLAAPYFALVSVVVFLYFAITPDNFHYGKYVAYTIPLYASLGAALYLQVIRIRLEAVRPLLDAAIAVASLAMCGAAIATLVGIGPEWQLRTYDAGLRAYFSSRPVTINGRLLDADINDRTVAHLAAFPAALPYDYLISPLDKYVLFLYDRHNGFDDIDNLSTMTDDARLATLESALAKPGRRTILDGDVSVVDPLAGLLSNHPVFGSINDQSAIDEKERVRFNELAGYLIRACANRSVDPARRWIYVTC